MAGRYVYGVLAVIVVTLAVTLTPANTPILSVQGSAGEQESKQA